MPRPTAHRDIAGRDSVTSSIVFFHVASSSFSATVGSITLTTGAFEKSSTGFVSALNCFSAACFSVSAWTASLYASSVASQI